MIDKKKLEKVRSLLDEAKSLIEEARDEAQEKFDEKSENWQQGDAGQVVEEKINYLSEAADNVDAVCDNLSDAMS